MKALSALMEGVRIEAVLADEVYGDVQLATMLCADITDKTQTSNIIRILGLKFPLPEFSHLKRVKGGEILKVLVCALESESKDIIEKFSTQLKNLDLEGVGSTSVVQVPRYQPITRTQYNRVSQLWPTHFHEDKMLEKVLRGENFSQDELADIRKFMETVLSHDSNSATNLPSSSVLIVDPGTKLMITQGHTDPSHPLKHATLLCLDQLASIQGGGAWNQPSQANSEDRDSGMGSKCPPPVKRAKMQYLCTGYDAYCSVEPCIMCSMALLHSRIGRVFFCHNNPSSGGLYSQYKIHSHKKLNHHFHVYKCESIQKPN